MARHDPRLRHAPLYVNEAALDRTAAKLRAEAPVLHHPFVAEAVDPVAPRPIPGGLFRLVTSSLARHVAACPVPSGNIRVRRRRVTEHLALPRRVDGAVAPGRHLLHADATRSRCRIAAHGALLRDAGFADIDGVGVRLRLPVCGAQPPPEASNP